MTEYLKETLLKKEVELIPITVFCSHFPLTPKEFVKNALSSRKLQRFIIAYEIYAHLRYQPPLPADQVKASAEFDYEGGSFTS